MGDCVSSSKEAKFTIHVKTGDRLHSGTDANVRIVLKDSSGNRTGELVLDKFFRNDFERGNLDSFSIKCPKHYGNDVVEIEFWRDNAGLASDWYVDRVSIENMKINETYVFPVYRWVKADFHYVIRHLDTSLPQFDSYVEQRNMELDDKRLSYQIIQKISGGPAQVWFPHLHVDNVQA